VNNVQQPLTASNALFFLTTQRQVPLIALQFSANNLFLSLAPAPPSGQEAGHVTAFVCGGAAGTSSSNSCFCVCASLALPGVSAKIITMPLDTAKKHLQVCASCVCRFP
jgi:hypothetical protein